MRRWPRKGAYERRLRTAEGVAIRSIEGGRTPSLATEGLQGGIDAVSVPEVTPLALRVEVGNLDALFDRDTEPSFPHAGRMVDTRLADYLENRVREHRKVRAVSLDIELRETPSSPSEEDAARNDLRAYFLAERQITDLGLRVNQREGWGFLRRTFPLLIAALALAGVLTIYGPGFPTGPVGELITALFYLLFITIVWVLLWDPIEKLLFDAYILRSRIAALERLGEAQIRFVHGSAPTREL